MALCRFSADYMMYDITPIENIFIDEFLTRAPGDYVKVYLFGLRQCYSASSRLSTLESFARAVSLDEKTVTAAFDYWQRQRLLQKISDNPLLIEYHNIKSVLNNSHPIPEQLTKYRDFNATLQNIFPNRPIERWEYELAYDWMELYRLPQEVVLLMVQHCLNTKGNHVGFKYINKVALTWAEKGIDSMSAVDEQLRGHEARTGGAARILAHLNIKREPTNDEMDLYRKWTETYGFKLDAILYACREMTKTSSPTLKYLDRVLEGLHGAGVVEKQAVSSYLTRRETLSPHVKELLYELGKPGAAATAEYIDTYDTWIKAGYSYETLVLAAKAAAGSRSRASFSDISTVLEDWSAIGIKDAISIKQYQNKQAQQDKNIRQILSACGLDRSATSADRKLYTVWTEDWQLTQAQILALAPEAIAAQNKLQYLNRILEARKDGKTSDTKPTRKAAKPAGQRSYTDDEIKNIFIDIEAIDTEETEAETK